MSDCCNPVIPPACINRCQQLYNACCVVDEQVLDCIFDPVVATASGTIGQTYIAVDDASGIVVGMEASGGGVGSGAVVTGIFNTTINLSVANAQTFPGASVGDEVTFNKIDNKQCDINKAINDWLCILKNGGVPCHTFTTATLSDPIANLVWTPGTPVQYSDVVNCTVRFKGTASAPFPPGPNTAVNSQLFVLPVASRPTVQKVLSITVVLNSDNEFLALYIPGIVVINPSGVVQVAFTNFNPLVARISTCPDCTPGEDVAKAENYFVGATEITAFISLDGLTFDTQ